MKHDQVKHIVFMMALCIFIVSCRFSESEPSRVVSGTTLASESREVADPYPIPVTRHLSDEYPIPITEDTSPAERLAYERDELIFTLHNGDLTDRGRFLIETRIGELELMIDRLENHPTRTPEEGQELFNLATAAAQHIPPPPPTPELGILPPDSIPFLFRICCVRPASVWQGYVDGARLLMYAGQLWPDNNHSTQALTNHGAVLVMLVINDEPRMMELYQTEDETGPLTILEATENGLLTLESAGYGELGKEMFSFNAATRELERVGE